MKRRAGSVGFWAATIILVLVAALSFSGVVLSRTDLDAAELEGYYREQENGMVKDARTYLNENGFQNSGIMLTRVVEEDGTREYTLTVHHGKITQMEDTEREALAEALSAFDFADENCTFHHEFLLMAAQ